MRSSEEKKIVIDLAIADIVNPDDVDSVWYRYALYNHKNIVSMNTR